MGVEALTARVPWAERRGRFTAMFEQAALLLLKGCSVSAAAAHLRISWDEADGIKGRAVARGLARKRPVPARAVCVDEKSAGKGHDYVTVVVRVPEKGAPFVDCVADGRDGAALDGYWARPGTGPLEDIRCASMDMWQPYVNSASAALPGGMASVAHDPFHLVQHANRAVDAARRQEQPLLGEEERRELKGTRFMWLYGFENLPGKWEQRMRAMKDGKTRTAEAWRLKEQFRAFYQCADWAQGRAFLDDWLASALGSGLEPVRRMARMIEARLPQVLNHFIHRVTNSFSEGTNGLIQMLIGRARGYRNRDRLKRDLYFHLGNLDMLPETL